MLDERDVLRAWEGYGAGAEGSGSAAASPVVAAAPRERAASVTRERAASTASGSTAAAEEAAHYQQQQQQQQQQHRQQQAERVLRRGSVASTSSQQSAFSWLPGMALWGAANSDGSSTSTAAPQTPTVTAPSPPVVTDKFRIAEAQAGRPTFALCRTTEARAGYWICFVLDYVPDAKDGKWMLKLARMEELESRLYACTPTTVLETFWEHENHLHPIELELADTTDTETDATLATYRLVSNVQELLNQTLHAPADDASRSLRDLAVVSLPDSEAFEVLYVGDMNAPDGRVEYKPVTTQAEIVARCDDLIAGLTAQVSMIDSTVQMMWKLVRVSENIEVFYKPTKSYLFHCYMARAVIKASPSEIKHILRHSHNREEFDPMCRGTSLVQRIDEASHILHFVDRKFLINRDFCVLRHDRTMPDGSVYLVSNSVRTRKCPVGEFVRSEVVHSGYSLVARGKGTCLMTYITQVNLNGWLPSMLVDYVLDLQVHGVISALRQYFELKQRYESNMKRGAATT